MSSKYNDIPAFLCRFPYHGFTSQCNFPYPSITIGNMLQQQSATFLRHFLNRLLHYRQLRMNQGSQRLCPTCSKKRHILRNAQATLLDSTLGSQHSSLRKAKDRIKDTFFSRKRPSPNCPLQPTRLGQDILRDTLYETFPVHPDSPSIVHSCFGYKQVRDMNNMLIALAQQSLHHEKRHDVIVHVHL